MKKLPVWVGCGIAAIATVAGISYMGYRSSISTVNSSANSTGSAIGVSEKASAKVIQSQSCITLVSDPTPPLNVRASPVVASDNVVGQLTNGTRLFVLIEQNEWLQTKAPIAGWVYKSLTITSCPTTNGVPAPRPATPASATQPVDAGPTLLTTATEQYQAGNLEVAMALAKAVSKNSIAYAEAQLAIAQWQQDWQQAETRFQAAQQAFQEQRWQDVLSQVNGFPEIRFWKEKLTPVVKATIERQGHAGGNYDNKTKSITLPANHRPATVAGRFASSGVHQYLLNGVQGQILTIDTGGLGPLPGIMAPDGTSLGETSDRSQTTRWTGKLPLSGTYRLKLDSRSQPYDYAFSVQLN
ncbi:SH3 domain-containing protein [Trichocoleus desertorum AS-A10]|uniref:SH3 domain-containing protein n=1 Tax=Trichocoleus desertorum TaxID=1481672 RepID=UPI003296FB9C